MDLEFSRLCKDFYECWMERALWLALNVADARTYGTALSPFLSYSVVHGMDLS